MKHGRMIVGEVVQAQDALEECLGSWSDSGTLLNERTR